VVSAVDRPVIAMVLVVAGVVMALAAVTISGNYMIMWRRSPAVWVESVDIMVNPATMLSYITVNVRNVGGQNLMSCTASILDPPIPIDDVTAPNIEAGRGGTFMESRVAGLDPTRTYIVEVRCTAEDGSPVVDKKSARPHI